MLLVYFKIYALEHAGKTENRVEGSAKPHSSSDYQNSITISPKIVGTAVRLYDTLIRKMISILDHADAMRDSEPEPERLYDAIDEYICF
jgi:hypothetical protein